MKGMNKKSDLREETEGWGKEIGTGDDVICWWIIECDFSGGVIK